MWRLGARARDAAEIWEESICLSASAKRAQIEAVEGRVKVVFFNDLLDLVQSGFRLALFDLVNFLWRRRRHAAGSADDHSGSSGSNEKTDGRKLATHAEVGC